MVRLTVQLYHEEAPETSFLAFDLDLPDARPESVQQRLEALFGVDPYGSLETQLKSTDLRPAFQRLSTYNRAAIPLVVTVRHRPGAPPVQGGASDRQPLLDFQNAVLNAVQDATGTRCTSAEACAAILELGAAKKGLETDQKQTRRNMGTALAAAHGALDAALQQAGMGPEAAEPPAAAGDKGKDCLANIYRLTDGIRRLQVALECKDEEIRSLTQQVDNKEGEMRKWQRQLEEAEETINRIHNPNETRYADAEKPKPGRL